MIDPDSYFGFSIDPSRGHADKRPVVAEQLAGGCLLYRPRWPDLQQRRVCPASRPARRLAGRRPKRPAP